MNVGKKIKKTLKRIFYSQNKKNVRKRDKKRYPIFNLLLCQGLLIKSLTLTE